MEIEEIAKVCHEMNRTYCMALGDDSQVSWEEAPDWQRKSAIDGVKSVLDGTATSSEEQHERWVEQKLQDGWFYGEEKDAEKKTHPCLMPYAELPPEQRAKDSLFRAVVDGLKG